MNETALIRLFVDLTGESDGAARSVLMYLEMMLEHDYFHNGHGESFDERPPAAERTPVSRSAAAVLR